MAGYSLYFGNILFPVAPQIINTVINDFLQQDIDSIQYDGRKQNTAHRAQDRILREVIVDIGTNRIIIFIPGSLVFPVNPKQDHDTDQRGEEDM